VTSDTERVAAARQAYRDLEPRVRAGEPWPLADDFGTGPEASWGPREVLAHVQEMLPFWFGEMERVVAGDGTAPVPFGRIADDRLRLGVIERDRTLPLRVLFARIDAGLLAWADRIPTLTEVEGARVGVHPRLGAVSAGSMLERFAIGHAEDHIGQLADILAERTG
jgi:hypothetical protein